jgi:hypothetical protein
MQQRTVEVQTLGTLMVLGQQLVPLLVVGGLELVRKAWVQGSQVPVPLGTEEWEFRPGSLTQSALGRTKHLLEEV